MTANLNTSNGKAYIYISFPLIHQNQLYTLNEAHSMPIWDEKRGGAVVIRSEGNFIAVSRDQTLFILPDAKYLQKCRADQSCVCPPSLPTYSSIADI
jgi:hypothetical protein